MPPPTSGDDALLVNAAARAGAAVEAATALGKDSADIAGDASASKDAERPSSGVADSVEAEAVAEADDARLLSCLTTLRLKGGRVALCKSSNSKMKEPPPPCLLNGGAEKPAGSGTVVAADGFARANASLLGLDARAGAGLEAGAATGRNTGDPTEFDGGTNDEADG